MYRYNENAQLAAARRAIEMARENQHDFKRVQMTKEQSKSFSDSLHKDMSSKDNYEFVK